MNGIKLMSPIFIVAIGAVGLIWTEEQPWVGIGYSLIGVLFAIIFGLIIFLQTPSQERINRKEWKNKTVFEKIKWKFRNGLRRN